MLNLGGNVIEVINSSAKKGESLEDTIKTVSNYGDIIVLRHPEKGSAERAAEVSSVPLINAGDGNGEHPTQALLDIYTIYKELKKDIKNDMITVTFLGDLKNSRTIHSLIHILTLFPKIRFIYVNPPTLEMPKEIINKLNNLNCEQITTLTLEEAIDITDILYVTRIQKERFTDEREYLSIMLEHNRNKYCVDRQIMNKAKKNMLLMHPLPRLDEIPVEFDSDPRAVYFTQVENGVYMRMAILDTIF
jgi:aspartate carbamoyltransferase